MFSERQRLDALYTIARTLRQQDSSPQAVMHSALKLTSDAIGVQHGCVVTFRKDDHIDEVFVLGESGDDRSNDKMWQYLITRGLIGFVHHGRRTIVIRDISTDPRWPRSSELGSGSQFGISYRFTDGQKWLYVWCVDSDSLRCRFFHR